MTWNVEYTDQFDEWWQTLGEAEQDAITAAVEIRSAILLIGGNKAGEWNAWYDRIVPVADAFYDEHLAQLKREEGRS